MDKNKKGFIIVSMRPFNLNHIGETRDTVDQKLLNWIKEVGYVPLLLPNTHKLISYLKNKQIKISGFVIGGGEIKYNSLRYKREKEILAYSISSKIPTLGICHGMQMMSHFEGGKLKKIKNHVRTRHNIISKSKVDRYPQKVNSYHDYTIKKLPPSFDIICTCEKNSIEAIKHKKYKWMGWMWHPERDKVFNKKLISLAKNFFDEHKL